MSEIKTTKITFSFNLNGYHRMFIDSDDRKTDPRASADEARMDWHRNRESEMMEKSDAFRDSREVLMEMARNCYL